MKYKYPVLAAFAFSVSLLLLWQFYETDEADDLLEASGRIEGRAVTVTPNVAAIVLSVDVHEGQSVETGDMMADLHDQVLHEKLSAAQSSLQLLQAQKRAAEIEYDLACSQVPLKIDQTQALLAAAQAIQEQSKINHEQAVREASRIEDMWENNLVAQQEYENSTLKVSLADIAVRAADANVVNAEKQLALARLSTLELSAQQASIDAIGCQIEQAEALLAEIESYISDLSITAPVAGTIVTRSIEPGERVTPGMPLFTLVDLDRLFLKIFVPEPHLGKITLGQEAYVYVNAYPNQPFSASISRISQQAEFTPKNIETREERVNLVFAVELQLKENPQGYLKPGMPADAIVRLTPDAQWPDHP